MRMRNIDDATSSPRRTYWARSFMLAALCVAAAACGPKYPNCEQDEDCKVGEFCVNQLCQQCRTNEDCGEGQQCNAGACEDIPNFCNSTGDCGEGEDCINQRCQKPVVQTSTQPEPVADSGPCEIEHVYFEYDSATLEAPARDAISRNADCMKERGFKSLQLVGHTDPRGTEEYNLALGDRRAQSVRKYLISLGIESDNVSASSMGEEMASGEDESGWATDRKVEFNAK